jgi:hypothetical protein
MPASTASAVQNKGGADRAKAVQVFLHGPGMGIFLRPEDLQHPFRTDSAADLRILPAVKLGLIQSGILDTVHYLLRCMADKYADPAGFAAGKSCYLPGVDTAGTGRMENEAGQINIQIQAHADVFFPG